ncbi:energy-coupling factor transporter ATP-binding protein EcfA2 [Clostridia bacterium]|nr:energy-coupling factor transporter ATP-binding protein EcfA2 [Clostridia bacterium]
MIETRNLSYVYGEGTPFEKRALDDLSVTMEKGRITGLIGHTGSGKSTLALILAGLLRPTSGSVYIGGEEVYKAEREQSGEGKSKKVRGAKKHNRVESEKMKFRAGIIFQYPEYQLFEETVYKDIAYGPSNMGLSKEEIDRRVRDAANFAGIAENLFEMSPFELSGGQKRRAAIAGVIAIDPEIMILDEPAAGLDPRGRSEILGGLTEYQQITGKTMIMISHSMEDMAKYADKILVLRDAKQYMYGDAQAIFGEAAKLKEAGLDVPQITKLFYELAKRGIYDGAGVFEMKTATTAATNMLRTAVDSERELF